MKTAYTITSEWDSNILDLIDKKPSLIKLKDWAIRIGVVYSEKGKTNKGKAVIASIDRVPDLYKEITVVDYIITIYKPSLAGLANDQVEIALFEQLLKIQIEEESDGSDIKDLCLKGYDYEGFKEIIDEYGSDWDRPWSRQLTIDDIQK
jgi:hypothetical protein